MYINVKYEYTTKVLFVYQYTEHLFDHIRTRSSENKLTKFIIVVWVLLFSALIRTHQI